MGWRLAARRLARVVLVAAAAASVSVFYLGGWLGPVFPPWAWSAVKTLSIAALMLQSLPPSKKADERSVLTSEAC